MWEEEGTVAIAERVDLAVASAFRYAAAHREIDPRFVHWWSGWISSCNDYADYLPTERALSGEGYSAMGTMVGTDGGDALVEKTVEMINKLF